MYSLNVNKVLGFFEDQYELKKRHLVYETIIQRRHF